MTQPAQNRSQTPNGGPKDDLCKALAATTGGPTRKAKNIAPPVLWFGLIGAHEVKRITLDPVEANAAAAEPKCRICQVYFTKEEAEAWLEEGMNGDNDTPPFLSRGKITTAILILMMMLVCRPRRVCRPTNAH
jgi:hypothetical protein